MSTGIEQKAVISIPLEDGAVVQGEMHIPSRADGVVLFAHAGDGEQEEARDRYIECELNFVRIATVVIDLLTEEEAGDAERARMLRDDPALLAPRLVRIIDWVGACAGLRSLPLGLSGANRSAGVILDASVDRESVIHAMVIRSGRTDLARRLCALAVPTLLIVGAKDAAGSQRNRAACEQLAGRAKVVVIPGATALFDEPGTLEAVAASTAAWFQNHLRPASGSRVTGVEHPAHPMPHAGMRRVGSA